MPHYYRKEYETEPIGEDKTPVHYYSIELSDRDVDALQHLKDRNGAGMENIMVENIAIWKTINQICELSKKTPKIEHPEWLV